MSAELQTWLSEPPPVDVGRALERLCRADDVVHVAVMPDVHLAEEVCVGVVVATTRLLYPAAVGGDIGCGMAALKLDLRRDDVDRADVAARILSGFERRVPIMAQPGPAPWPASLDDGPRAPSVRKAACRRQLGTLGRGNHFLELQVDEADDVWLTVHSGSRGPGRAIATHHLGAGHRTTSGLIALDADSAAGRDYLDDVQWALRYASASRDLILECAAEVLHDVTGAVPFPDSRIACDHNHVVRQRHAGRDLWVHRKGAMRAELDEAGVIPGSMGQATFHVRGRGCAAALCSSSHGAGRAMSRQEARRRVRIADLNAQVAGVWYDHRKAGRLVEEAPAAYKDITKVMRAQGELVRIERRLQPLLSFKGV